MARGVEIGFEAFFGNAVIAESVEGCRRNRIDGVWSDKLLNVDHIAIAWILGAGRRPEQTLCLPALGLERVPSWAAVDLLVPFVSELSIGDGDFA